MEKVLSRGLNFCILPLKLDVTQVLVDFKRFERSMIWKEFWYGRETKEKYEKPIFKTRKTNLPKNCKPPNGLKTYLGAVKSELMDPKNREKVNNNLPNEEIAALKQLVILQKERQITIKKCDKGAGIMILDFNEYIKACTEHLEGTTLDKKGNLKHYYKKVDHAEFEIAKTKIQLLIEEGYNNNIITKDEYEAMCPEGKHPSKFYCNFKIHKPHEHGTAPPVRPIISGSGSIAENLSKYVDHHIKEGANNHDSFLQDTPDFLRQIEQVNSEDRLPENTILATFDVKALYTNIPQGDGMKATRESLNERKNPKVPTEYIIRMLELILKNNIFLFSDQFYKQQIGTAMGTKPAPHYADIFMARRIDGQIIDIAIKYSEKQENPIKLMKRYLDDIFQIFIGSTKQLHILFEKMNNIHPNIKFTMSHTSIPLEDETLTCMCPPQKIVPFLDTSCQLKNGKIVLDLYRKPTDQNMYLLPSSCHPPSCLQSIPYSLALRIVRICSDPESRETRFNELKQMLLAREYRPGMIEAAIIKARAVPRKKAIQFVASTKQQTRPVFVVSWDPRLPSIDAIQQKHWRSMTTMDPYLKEVFPQPPMTAYKRSTNIKDLCIRAKVPPLRNGRQKRQFKGMKKCTTNCIICPYIMEAKKITSNKFTWNINKLITCNSSNLIYMIVCTKENCQQNYIGESGRKLRERIVEHIGYVNTKNISQATGHHFNLPGHNLTNMKITGIEIVKKQDVEYRKERESYLIRKFNTFHQGINRKP
jgi:hypothetical protein